MKYLVIGNFGFKKKQLDGQTIKTRTVFDALERKFYRSVDYVDVGGVNPILSIAKIIGKLFSSEVVLFLPGKKQLYVVGGILCIFKLIKGIKVHYVVVGGWLNSLYDNSLFVRMIVNRFDSVNLEIPSMVRELSAKGIKANLLTNFRFMPEVVNDYQPDVSEKGHIKFLYFSRIMREKGVFLAIDLVEKLRSSGMSACLTIHGQDCLTEQDRNEFNDKLGRLSYIDFRGEIEPDAIYRELSGFDVLLFPTTYQGEGFPGCIVDAKFCGITVFATDWKYNKEIILNNFDGMLFSVDDFINESHDYLQNIDSGNIEAMKIQSYKSSSSYSEASFYKWLNDL